MLHFLTFQMLHSLLWPFVPTTNLECHFVDAAGSLSLTGKSFAHVLHGVVGWNTHDYMQNESGMGVAFEERIGIAFAIQSCKLTRHQAAWSIHSSIWLKLKPLISCCWWPCSTTVASTCTVRSSEMISVYYWHTRNKVTPRKDRPSQSPLNIRKVGTPLLS